MGALSNAELADIIESEGLGYAIEENVPIGCIEDPATREMWAQARASLYAIRQRCFNARAAMEDEMP